MLKRRRKKNGVNITCRYCDCFWSSPSRTEGRGNAATTYRACRRSGEEVTRDTPACDLFQLSTNIHCEKFHNRMSNVCCLSRAKHKYGDEFCWKKCRQVAIIRSSYDKMNMPHPETRKPNLGALKPLEPQRPTKPHPPVISRLKRRDNTKKQESSVGMVKKLKRSSTPVVKKLKRRRRK
jgi:hypothetical protein